MAFFKSVDEWLGSSDDDDDDRKKDTAKTATPSVSPTTATLKTAGATSVLSKLSAGATTTTTTAAATASAAGVPATSGATTPGATSSIAGRSPALQSLAAVRERMSKLLGTSKVEEIVTSTREKKQFSLDSSDSDFETESQLGSISEQQSKSKKSTPVDASRSSTPVPQQQQQKNGGKASQNANVITVSAVAEAAPTATAAPAPPTRLYEEVEVMLVDRGCQTASTVECQTDPEPSVFSCAKCYTNYFGHAPATAASGAVAPCCGGMVPIPVPPHLHHLQHQAPPFHFIFDPNSQQQQQQQQEPPFVMSMKQQVQAVEQHVRQNLAPISAKAINSQIDVIQRQIDALMRRIGTNVEQI